jgi:hypothetical protein
VETWLCHLATNDLAFVVSRLSASSESYFPVQLIGMTGVCVIYFTELDSPSNAVFFWIFSNGLPKFAFQPSASYEYRTIDTNWFSQISMNIKSLVATLSWHVLFMMNWSALVVYRTNGRRSENSGAVKGKVKSDVYEWHKRLWSFFREMEIHSLTPNRKVRMEHSGWEITGSETFSLNLLFPSFVVYAF